ncbi:MAG: hypothetical protein LBQ40_03905 [Clostridiales bacterium]|jgi:hypothetical protein|nr:hypothetical protein [Clostridiales bacterium]
MWSTIVSIDKRYQREFAYITGEISKSKYSSYAVEESRYRYYIHIVAEDEYGARISGDVVKLITDVILVYFKAEHIKRRLLENRGGGEISDAMAILISALIYFDVGIESGMLEGMIEPSEEYSIDGLFTFRTAELTSNWNELCALSGSLLSMNPSEHDILNLTSFLIDASNAKKNKISVGGCGDDPLIFNVSTNEKIFIHDIFSNGRQNLLNAIISCYPEEIYAEDKLPCGIVGSLQKITKVSTANA